MQECDEFTKNYSAQRARSRKAAASALSPFCNQESKAMLQQGGGAPLALGTDPTKPKKNLRAKDLLPVLKGYINKQDNNIFHTWSDNWFVLEKDQLFYYKTDRDLEHQGSIDLSKIKSIQLGPGEKESWQFSLVTPERTFYLQVPSEKERKFWVYGLRAWMQHFGYLPRKKNRKTLSQAFAIPPLEGDNGIARRRERSFGEPGVTAEDLIASESEQRNGKRGTHLQELNGENDQNGTATRADRKEDLNKGRRPLAGLTKSVSVASLGTSAPIVAGLPRRGGKLHTKLGIVDDMSIQGRANAELLANRKLLQNYADDINGYKKKQEQLEALIDSQAKEIERLRTSLGVFEEKERIREQLTQEKEQKARDMLTSLKLTLVGGGPSSSSTSSSSSSSPVSIPSGQSPPSPYGSPSSMLHRSGGYPSSSPPRSSYMETLHNLRQIEENLQLDHGVYKAEMRMKDEKIAELGKTIEDMKKSLEENKSLKTRAVYFERLLDEKLRGATEESKAKDREVGRLQELLWETMMADLQLPSEQGKTLLKRAVKERVKEEGWREWVIQTLEAEKQQQSAVDEEAGKDAEGT